MIKKVVVGYAVLAFAAVQEVQWNCIWLGEQSVPLASWASRKISEGLEAPLDFGYWEIRRLDHGKSSKDY